MSHHAIKRARNEDPSTSDLNVDDGKVAAHPAAEKRRLAPKTYLPDDESAPADTAAKAPGLSGKAAQDASRDHPVSDAEDEVPEEDLTDESARALVAQGDALSGDALKDFLKKNFTDFIDDQLLDFPDIDDI